MDRVVDSIWKPTCFFYLAETGRIFEISPKVLLKKLCPKTVGGIIFPRNFQIKPCYLVGGFNPFEKY